MTVLFELFLIHIKKFFRQPAILFWAIVFPVIMAWILGVAFSKSEVQQVPVGVVGFEMPAPLPQIKWVPTSLETLRRDMRLGVFAVYVTLENGVMHAHYDAKNQAARSVYLTLDQQIAHQSGWAGIPVSYVTQQGSRYIDFLLPGLAAMSIMNSALWGLGWSTIEMRMKKMLRRMVATPMSKFAFLGSLVLARIVVGFVELALLFVFCALYFDLTFVGHFGAFLAVFLAGNIAFCGFGILVASRTANTTVANGLINAVTLPMMVLSGVFFSYRQFPDWAVSVIQYLPLTQLADAFRLLLNEPAGFQDVWLTVVLLCVTGVFTSLLGLKWFRWH